jgi:1-acyl-sn-glycerol-3-phosphate acyltransferase
MAKKLTKREIQRRTRGIYRAIGNAPQRMRSITSIKSSQFPYRAAQTPRDITPLEKKTYLGSQYPTTWARRLPARTVRLLSTELIAKPLMSYIANPKRIGYDRLEGLKKRQPIIFVANHHSHADTPLLLTSIPVRWRKRLIVGAAADYFFKSKIGGSLSALFIGAIPVERTKVSRTSSDEIASLINHGWSFMVFPEGGRSPDGWGQPFRAGAAYLSIKCNTPVVPIHLAGTGNILRKGKLWPTRSSTKVIFGNPIWPSENENSRSYSKRIEQAVAELADEGNSDWWIAKKRKYSGETPSLQAPEMGSWRKAWKLESSSSRSKGSKERWPTI